MNRSRFPGLADGWARLDGPAGTQPVSDAVDAMAAWMRSGAGANLGGAFSASRRTGELVSRTRRTVGGLFGADPEGVVFGPSMTSLTLAFAAAVGRTLTPGDEIVCTRLDHDANVTPWLLAAERSGAVVRMAEPEPGTLELPAGAIVHELSERTRWVAVTAASNAVGTVPDLPGIVAAAHGAGARVLVDAVHAAPHRALDMGALGCDALVSSAYKWFGPHAAVLCAKPELLAALVPDRLRPAPAGGPGRWESGTGSFEALAGVAAAAEYLAEVGWEAVGAHETRLLEKLLDGLGALPRVTIHGRPRERTPTVSFSVAGSAPLDVATALAEAEVAVWHGNHYALELSGFLGLEPQGAVRAGIVHYNEESDVERLLAGLDRLLDRDAPPAGPSG